MLVGGDFGTCHTSSTLLSEIVSHIYLYGLSLLRGEFATIEGLVSHCITSGCLHIHLGTLYHSAKLAARTKHLGSARMVNYFTQNSSHLKQVVPWVV